MGFIARLFNRPDAVEERAALPDWYSRPSMNILTPSDAGVKVDQQAAMGVAAVISCVRVITDAISSLPCQLFDDDGNRLKDHPLAGLLSREANDEVSASTWREATIASLLLTGNSYSFIDRGLDERPIGLYPLAPAATQPLRRNGVLTYQTQTDAGLRTLDPSQVIHLRFLTLDGITGVNPIATMRNALGLAIAAEKMAAKFFANGGNLGSILKLPPMSEAAIENFTSQWKKKHLGIDNAHRVGVLPDGYNFETVGHSPEAGQMLDSRKFQVAEVARVYRVPLSLIDQTANASFASIESQERMLYEQAIRPLVTKLEDELERKLLTEADRGVRIKLNMDSRMRAETSSRYTAHAAGINAGFLSVNEARAFENLPAVPGGDTLLRPLNLGPVNEPTPPAAKRDDALARQIAFDAADRVLRKEAAALSKAAKKYVGDAGGLRSWTGDFYGQRHRDLVAKAFTAAIRAAGSDTTPDAFAIRHCEQAVTDIAAATTAGNVADLVERFDERADAIADQLLKGKEQ